MALSSPFEVLTFIGHLAPLFIILFITLLSFFNGSVLKPTMYLFGVIIVSGICILVSQIPGVKSPIPKDALYACRTFAGNGMLDFSVPSISTAILTFTAAYLIFPMMQQSKPNIPLFTFLFFMIGLNSYTKINAGCTTLIKGILSGLAIGLIIGFGWVLTLQASTDDANSTLLLFSETLTNGQICSRPKQEQFHCKVFKDGKLSSM